MCVRILVTLKATTADVAISFGLLTAENDPDATFDKMQQPLEESATSRLRLSCRRACALCISSVWKVISVGALPNAMRRLSGYSFI